MSFPEEEEEEEKKTNPDIYCYICDSTQVNEADVDKPHF